MSTYKVIDAFRDHVSKRVFIRWTDGTISVARINELSGSITDTLWFGDPDNIESSDPEGIVWAALTGQRSSEARTSLENLPKRSPNVAKFYCDDEPLTATNCEGAIAKLDRIRAAARKLSTVSIDQGGVRDNQDVAALLVEIFAP